MSVSYSSLMKAKLQIIVQILDWGDLSILLICGGKVERENYYFADMGFVYIGARFTSAF